MTTRIAINGVCGRMGQRIAHLAHADEDLEIIAALDAAGHPHIGHELGNILGLGNLGIVVQTALPPQSQVDALIDFSLPQGTMTVLPICVSRQIPLVIATTGHEETQLQEIESATKHIPVLMAPNMSLVVNLLFKLAHIAGAALQGKDFDVEIIERHHRFKKDAPSGTALRFEEIIRETMGQSDTRHGRDGLVGERPHAEIGMHAVRVGDNVGEHTVIFSTLGETMELIHRAHSRDSYARGALQAAKFLAGRSAGAYSMVDVLGLD